MYQYKIEDVLEKLPGKLTPAVGATVTRAYIRTWYQIARILSKNCHSNYEFKKNIIENTLRLNDDFDLPHALGRDLDWLVFVTMHRGNILPMRNRMNQRVTRQIRVSRQLAKVMPFSARGSSVNPQ